MEEVKLRLIYLILVDFLISACSVTAEVNESSAPKVTEPDQGSEPMENTGTIETPEITGTKGPSEQEYGEKITLKTSDGVQLAAVFYASESLNAAPDVLILVHEAYRDRSSWDDFRTAALENGYAVVALDLRGHGQSGGDLVFDETMDHDIDAVLDWIRASPDLNDDRIAIAGASLGANLALRAGARHPQINTVVRLSPGMMLWEIGIENTILDYGRRPVLLVVSEGDAYPAQSVQRLNELGMGYDKVVIYPGAGHGTEMIRSQPDLTPLMFSWFEQTMD